MAPEADSVSIKVVARFRPLNDKERAMNMPCPYKFIGEDLININGKAYMFDRIFKELATQEEVYNFSAKPIVADILNGYNGTIFAYGQTSSGKTHTMEGEIGDAEWQGIIPRIVDDIFNYIYSMEENVEFHIKVSYFEIYMERIRDLLDTTKTNLPIHEDKHRVPYVKGVTERFVGSPEEVIEIITEGKSNRAVSVTNMNEHSSRSHSVFQLSIQQVNMESQQKLFGKLYLVDLAGSEKVSKTQAEGMTLDEAKNINKSLSALGHVIASLSEGQSHIPYRDSKMTRVLQESLGGNARTTIVICCSPSPYNESETKSTIFFGSRAKTITNSVSVNVELTAEEWRARYEKEVEKNKRLKVLLAKCDAELQRWRRGDTVSEEEQTKVTNTNVESKTGFDLSPSPSTASISNLLNVNNASDADKIAFVKERDSLYKALDDKDDEINKQSQLIERLKRELEDEKQSSAMVVQQNEQLGSELLNTDMEREKYQEEIKQVMAALEQVATNLDEKTEDVENRIKENHRILAELDEKVLEADKAKSALEQWKQKYSMQTSRTAKGVSEIIEELGGISTILGSESMANDISFNEDDFSKVEENFTLARVFANKTKTVIESMMDEHKKQTKSYNDSLSQIVKLESDISEGKDNILEGEQKVMKLETELKEANQRKRKLEDEISLLNDECGKLRESEETRIAMENQGKKEASEMKSTLEKQIESTRDGYQRQLNSLKDDIADRENQLRSTEEKYQEEQQRQLKLKSQLDDAIVARDVIAKKLSELEFQLELKARARQETRGIEEIANKELANIRALRVAFVDDLQSRIKQTNAAIENEDNASTIERQRIAFLENNLDQLTNVHKQLVRDNSELRCELPKMERRLMAKIERVKSLEQALKESKERGIAERQRYQKELEQVKSWSRLKRQPIQKTTSHANIAKPIRGGQRGQISSEASAVIKNTPEKSFNPVGIRRNV